MNDLLLSQSAIQKELDNFKKSVAQQNKNLGTATTTVSNSVCTMEQLFKNLQKENTTESETIQNHIHEYIIDEIRKIQSEIDALGNFVELRFEDWYTNTPSKVIAEAGERLVDKLYTDVSRPQKMSPTTTPSTTPDTLQHLSKISCGCQPCWYSL